MHQKMFKKNNTEKGSKRNGDAQCKAPYAIRIVIMPYHTSKVNNLPSLRQQALCVDTLHTHTKKHRHLKPSHWVRDTRNCNSRVQQKQDQFDWSPWRKCFIKKTTNICFRATSVLFTQNSVEDTVLDYINNPAQGDGNIVTTAAVISYRQIDQHSS